MNSMSTTPLSCPYCNASIDLPAETSASGRIDCPRCGDSFAIRPADAVVNRLHPTTSSFASGPAAYSDLSPVPALDVPSRRSNGRLAAIAVGVMLLVAGVGLAFMLKTQAQRRIQDTVRPARRPFKQPGVPELSGVPVVESVAPDRLEALGYLPADVNLLVAARIPELAANSIGARMLREPLKIGGAEQRLADLPSWVGLQAEEIDHLVLGARIKDDIVPPFYLVIRTVRPHDAEELRKRLNKSKRVASASKKKLFEFRPLKRDIPVHAWFADERTVVLALIAEQLESLPNEPVAELRQFAPELRRVLRERRELVAPIWMAGHSPDWTKTLAAKLSIGLKKDDWGKLASLRTFGIWIVPDKSLAVKGIFSCKDEAGARVLDTYFRSLSVPDSNFKSALDDSWLTVQFQAGPGFLARALHR